MAQTNFTPISIYYSATATNVPTAGNLVAGELALNTADGKLFYKDSAGVVQTLASKAGNVNVSSFSAGSTGLTPSTATTGVVTLAGTLNVSSGGTGLSTLTAGYIPYGNGTSALGSSANLTFDGNNLGIGGTQSYSGYRTLLVQGTNVSNGGVIQIQNSDSSVQSYWVNNAAIVTFGSVTSTPVGFITGNTEKMRLTSAGGLSIGTTSDAGAGNVRATGVFFAGDGSTSNNSFARAAGAGTGIYFPAASTIGFSTSATEVMRLDSSGNLGLGVTPSAWQSGFKALESSSGNSWYATSGASALASNTYFNGGWIYKTTSTAGLYANAQGVHQWFTAPSSTAGSTVTFTQAMTLDASGNLLVGTTSQINSCKVGVVFDATTQIGLVLKLSANTSAAAFQYYIDNSGNACGSITRVGTTSAVVYTATSDYRLKTVIGSVSDAGQRIDALEPIEYDWNTGGRTRGFLAHQFAEVYPNSVSGEKDAVDKDGKPVYQSMQASSSEVMADLIAEIQSLRKRVAQLESK